MADSEDRTVVERLERLSQIEPGRESTELALEHARAALVNLPAATPSRPPELARPWTYMTHWIGGLTMRQRIAALGGVGVAALLGFVLLWGGLVTRPVSAMEKMAETIRRAKSLKATVVEDVPNSNPSMPRVFAVMGTLYWLAPDSTCLDLKGILIPGKSSGERHDVTWIYLVGKRAICIDHKAKTFKWVSNYHRHTNLEEMLAKLAEFSGQADRDLGVRNIDGKQDARL